MHSIHRRQQPATTMGKANHSGLRRVFTRDEYGQLEVPPRFSNVKLARIEHAVDRGGCTRCFPHGPETSNATNRKNTHSWKNHRKTRYRVSV